MERLDKVISNQTEYSRKDAKYLALKRKITVNGEIIFRSDIKVDPDKDVIAIDGKNINVKDHVYLILN